MSVWIVWILVLGACSSARADPSSKGARVRIPSTGCVDPKSADITRAQTLAAKRSSEARTKALQAIKPLVLKAHVREVGQGIDPDPRAVLRGPVATATVDGVTGRFVVGPSRWSGSAGPPEPEWQFGLVAGKAVRLVAQPRVVSETTVAICGCKAHVCGPVGSGCPGCGSTTQVVYGPLPDGIDYAGDHAVPFDNHLVHLEYKSSKACPPPRACPQPP